MTDFFHTILASFSCTTESNNDDKMGKEKRERKQFIVNFMRFLEPFF